MSHPTYDSSAADPYASAPAAPGSRGDRRRRHALPVLLAAVRDHADRRRPAGDARSRRRDFPTNRGGLCSKGWTAAELLDHPRPAAHPAGARTAGDRPARCARPPGTRRSTGSPTAIAARRSSATARTRSACFGGGGLTNEKAYTLGKFARVALRTATIDYNGRFCMSSAATAGNRAFGVDRGLPFPLSDIAAGRRDPAGRRATRPTPCRRPCSTSTRAARARRPAHRRRPAAHRRPPAGATLHLQPLPGTDLALANGLLHIAIRDGLVDEAYIADAHHRLRRACGARSPPYWPDRVERITGVAVADSARRSRSCWPRRRPAMILTARGAEQHSNGTDTAQAFINLALALGLPGTARAPATAPSPGRATARAAASTARRPTSCPATAGSTTRPPARTSPRSGASTRTSCRGPGRSAYEMLDRLGTDGGVRALLVLASNIVVSAPRRQPRRATGSRALDLLVVSDIFLSETAALADVVLPTAQWAEEDGTMTNLEGRVIRRRRPLPPPAGVLDRPADAGRRWPTRLGPRAVLLAPTRGRSSTSCAGPAPAGSPTTPASPTSGSTRRRACSGPARPSDHPGTPRHVRRAASPTPDGRARFLPVEHRGAGRGAGRATTRTC